MSRSRSDLGIKRVSWGTTEFQNVEKLNFAGSGVVSLTFDNNTKTATLTVQDTTGGGLTNAWDRMTDGTNTAQATGADIFKLAGSTSVSVVVSPTLKQATFAVLAGGVDHNSLANLTTGNPHTQYQLRSEKGIANGYASLDAGALVNETVKKVRTITDPSTPAQGELWVNGKNLKYRDNQATPATQIVEIQSNKNVANGYAGLDASGKISAGQISEVIGLTNLSDTTITTPATGDLLKRGATEWENFAKGTANQVIGVKPDGSDLEYKTIQGTTNQVNVSYGTGTITLSTPQDIHTGASPTFAGLNITGNINLNGTLNQNISKTGNTLQIGTADLNNIYFITNNTSKYSIDPNGVLKMLGNYDFIPYSNNVGEIGTTTNKWAYVRATNVVAGDLHFENQFYITEDKDGLVFYNDNKKPIMKLDKNGNLLIKGKIKKWQ